MTVLLILSTLLTLSAFIYTFVVTYQTWDQTISIPIAIQQAPSQPYPLDSWTPETWYRAVLRLSIVDSSVAHSLRFHNREMAAWRWWILPYLLVNAFALACTVVHTLKERKKARYELESEARELKK